MLSLEMLFEDFLAGCSLKRTSLYGAGEQPGLRNTEHILVLCQSNLPLYKKSFNEKLGRFIELSVSAPSLLQLMKRD
jgi:hypothetical protein